MPLGMEVGLKPGDFGLDGDPASPSQKEGGGRGKSPPNFRPMAIVAERLDGSRWHLAWMMEVVHIVLDGNTAPLPKTGAEPPRFSAHLYSGQTAGCIKMPLGTRLASAYAILCSMWTCSYPQKKRHTHPTQFLAHVYCGQMVGWMKTPLDTEVHIVLDGVPARAKGAQQPRPLFSAHGYCGHGRPSQLLLSSCSIFALLALRLCKGVLLIVIRCNEVTNFLIPSAGS